MNTYLQCWRISVVCLLAALELIHPHSMHGQVLLGNASEGLQIRGRYSHITRNGAPPKTNNYQFVAFFLPQEWEISVTNASNPKEFGVIRYDGTAIYTLSADSLNAYKIFGYVYSGEFYSPEAQDTPYFFFPWMVFNLTPEMLQAFNGKGLADIPAPWSKRYSLLDFGFRWKTSLFEDGNIIQKIEAVRDTALDLKSQEDELHRTTLNYPFEYSSREHRLETLQLRKELPGGFVRAVYECSQVFKTNGCTIPSKAEFAQYYPNYHDPKDPVMVVFEMALTVDRVELLRNSGITPGLPLVEASIKDYRYQRTNNRTKFNFAAYKLKPGDPFPASDDPDIVAQATNWLRQGMAYNSLQSRRRKTLAALAITLTLSGLLVYWLMQKKHN